MKCLLPLILWLFSFAPLHAFYVNAKGFVVTNKQDTIMGEVRINLFNQASGAVCFNSFDNEILHSEVWFRPAGIKKWKHYTPDNIKLFSFIYRQSTYEYRSFRPEKKSLVRSERSKARFLMLVHSSKVKLYKDVRRIFPSNPEYELTASYYTYTDYYLYSAEEGLIKAQKSKECKSVNDVLLLFGLEYSFVKQIPDGTSFKALPEILSEYVAWRQEVRT
ncbi:hypothetical protein [Carboxylicivirga linearis]|uniref:DUF4369 domain-containing protein n=1 Tax=Carboxylicivirga linearis TaxID=1628157 RepID=A0ABS5JSL3_9BACT|nr:hypothetical protein [Carboxylicivirga linearis]MBS2097864.1 hypothetical protein [Carboxylicivirga linearis]